MMKRLMAGLAMAAVGLGSPVTAQERATLKLEGLYLFSTDAQHDGMPVCSEAWDFAADGTMRIESGQERVLKRYRVETNRDGHWLVSEKLETNGAPDCMGHASPEVRPGEDRLYLVPMNSGVILTCPPPQRTEDGAPFVSGCFGRIVLGSEAG